MIPKIVTIIIAIISILAWFVFVEWADRQSECLRTNPSKPEECLTSSIQELPPLEEAKELQKSCKEADLRCLGKIGQMAAEKRLEEEQR